MRGRSKVQRSSRAPRERGGDGRADSGRGGYRALLLRGCHGALAVAAAVLTYHLLGSSACAVERVEVAGTYLLSIQEVAVAAGVEGRNVFTIDRRRVADSVRELGVVEEVEVAVALPASVRIRVVEKPPKYIWQSSAESYLVDEQGLVLGPVPGAVGLPTVRETEGPPRRRGDVVDAAALRLAAKLVSLWPASLGEGPVYEYGPRGLAVMTADWRAELGDEEDLEAKMGVLAAIVERANAAGSALEYVDLRFVDRPYFR